MHETAELLGRDRTLADATVATRSPELGREAWTASAYLTGSVRGPVLPAGRSKLGWQLVSLLLVSFRTLSDGAPWFETNSETNWLRKHAATGEQTFAI
jgi:hypothetical protein